MVNRSHRLLEATNVQVCPVPPHLRRRCCRRRNAHRGRRHRPRVGRPTVARAGRRARRADGWATSTLARMTLEEKVGQLFIQNVYGKDATTPDARNIPLYGVASPAEVVQKYHLGGVIYFAWTDSVQNPPQIAGLSNGLQKAALSQPSRSGSRCRSPPTRSRAWSPASARRRPSSRARWRSVPAARRRRPHRGRRSPAPSSRRWGSTPTSRRTPTSTSTRSTRSSARARSPPTRRWPPTWSPRRSQGYQATAGSSRSAKHFPGHGDTATDSHVAFPIITHTRQQWEQIDAPPFKAAIAAGIDMIMTAHLIFPALDDSGDPATLSKPIMTGLLRERAAATRGSSSPTPLACRASATCMATPRSPSAPSTRASTSCS